MKVKLKSYAHVENGLSIQIIPETEVEEVLLNSFMKHGDLQIAHPGSEVGKQGYYINNFNGES